MRVLEGVKKGQQTAQAIRRGNGQRHSARHGQRQSEEQIDKARAAGNAHEEQNAGQNHGAPEIRLQKQQETEKPRYRKGRNDPPAERLNQVLLGAHEIGQIQRQRYFDELHGLDAHRPQRNPSLGAVDGMHQRRKRDQQQQQRQENCRILQPVEPLTRHQSRNPQTDAPRAGKKQLSLEEIVFIAAGFLGHDAAGRQHHDQTDGQQDQRQRQQPPVKAARRRIQRARQRAALAVFTFALVYKGILFCRRHRPLHRRAVCARKKRRFEKEKRREGRSGEEAQGCTAPARPGTTRGRRRRSHTVREVTAVRRLSGEGSPTLPRRAFSKRDESIRQAFFNAHAEPLLPL